MLEPAPIKTDLFRFITTRTPQLINPAKLDLGFVYHPEEKASHFLSAIKSDDIDDARESVQGAANTFAPIRRYREIRNIDPAVYDFSHWLVRNKKRLTKPEVVDKLKKLKPLGKKQLLLCWDNLYYQCVNRDIPTVRQACIQMIIADNFIRKATHPDMEKIAEEIIDSPRNPELPEVTERIRIYLQRLANARVVLSKAFSREKENTSVGSNLNRDYGLEFERSLNMARAKGTANKALRLNRELSNVKRPVGAECKTSAGDLLAEAENGDVMLTGDLTTYLRELPASDMDLKDITDRLQKEADEGNKEFYNLGSTKSRKDRIQPYCYYVYFEMIDNGTADVFFSIRKPNSPGLRFRSAKFKLKINGKVIAQGQDVDRLPYGGNLLHLELFPNKRLNVPSDAEFDLSGVITMSNGEKIRIAVNGNVMADYTRGCADPKSSDNDDDTDDTTTDTTESSGIELFGVNRLGMGIFRKVEQEVCCYVPGEVSRIENILAREYKERHTRSLTSTETTEEDTTEYEIENQTDTATTVRNELQSEVANVIDEGNNLGVGASAGVSASYAGGVTISANGYLDYASSTAASESDSEAKSYAEEVTQSAAERVLQKTTQKRTSKILQEYEENNRHGFDNRAGEQHVTGVYRWVDIIYTNRLVNYGQHLMVEFLIPEPARFYKMALEGKAMAETGTSEEELGEEPVHPSEYGLNGSDDLIGYNSDDESINYRELADIYGVEIEAPPAEEASMSQTFSDSDVDKTDEFSGNGTIPIPTGYRCNRAHIEVSYRHDSRNIEGTHWVVTVGDDSWSHNIQEAGNNDRTFSDDDDLTFSSYLSSTVGVSYSGDRTLSYHIVVTLQCEVLPEDYQDWQSDGYNKIMDAYNAQLAEYEANVAAIEDAISESMEESGASNPAFNRTLEQREIQRVAIEMLMKPFEGITGVSQGADHYVDVTACDWDIPQVNQTEAWKIYSSHVKFFEQAFEWGLMAYIFYPYYWADKCDWVDLFQTKDSNDPIFEAFLQSGMARVVIPVRLGFESAVDLYLETGDIWNGGGLVLETDDDLYLSIEEELAEPVGRVEDEWQTRVPTSLTIVQGDSVYLEDEGLPCCDDMEESGVDTKLRGSTNTLGVVLDSPESE